ncbi:uncharacterized protein LOC134460473 [Engraulis encrasicolus]|uniref:uncharacterized protein LOC134460473 n=1 Tax=Engraulis encrasicolus TaxID=184585 RepID=UPI002FD0CDD6
MSASGRKRKLTDIRGYFTKSAPQQDNSSAGQPHHNSSANLSPPARQPQQDNSSAGQAHHNSSANLPPPARQDAPTASEPGCSSDRGQLESLMESQVQSQETIPGSIRESSEGDSREGDSHEGDSREGDSSEEQSSAGYSLDIQSKPNQPHPECIPVQKLPEKVLCFQEQCLEKMGVNNAKANGLRDRFEKGKTVLGLNLALEALNKSLQKRTQTVAGMMSAIGCVRDSLRANRSEAKFREILNKTEEMIDSLGD